jgi:hydroxyacylglutathione hydrolase
MRIPQKLLFAKINISPIAELVAAQTFAASCGPGNGVFAARKNFKQPVAGIVILREAWLSSTRQKGTQIMAAQIHQFLCLKDNFAVLIHDPATRATAAIDAPVAAPILAALEARRWALTDVLVTHHHFDHVQGLAGLKAKFPRARIIGPAKEAERIGGLDLGAGEGDRLAIGALEARVIEVPGHTSGHIAYWFASEEVLFAGDALFALGCGRGFEEPPEVLYHSLLKLAALPGATRVYCGHEYTLANARFALSVDPANEILKERARKIALQCEAGEFTLPTTIATELATNPFLRVNDPKIQDTLGMKGSKPAAVFTELRERKNRF